MARAKDAAFFALIDAIEAKVRGAAGAGLEVAAFQVVAEFSVLVRDAVLWIILKGPREAAVPERCLGAAKRDAFRRAAPEQAAFCERLEAGALALAASLERPGFTLEIGFESRARVDGVGAYNYFR